MFIMRRLTKPEMLQVVRDVSTFWSKKPSLGLKPRVPTGDYSPSVTIGSKWVADDQKMWQCVFNMHYGMKSSAAKQADKTKERSTFGEELVSFAEEDSGVEAVKMAFAVTQVQQSIVPTNG